MMYTVIQSLTADGRDRGLDYKLSGFHVPPGSPDAEVRVVVDWLRMVWQRLHVQRLLQHLRCMWVLPILEGTRCCSRLLPGPHLPLAPQMLPCIAPGPDEIVLPKTSSSVFQSTNIDYLLRSLGMRQLLLCGCVTGGCRQLAGTPVPLAGCCHKFASLQPSGSPHPHSAAADQCVEHAVRDACESGHELKAGAYSPEATSHTARGAGRPKHLLRLHCRRCGLPGDPGDRCVRNLLAAAA